MNRRNFIIGATSVASIGVAGCSSEPEPEMYKIKKVDGSIDEMENGDGFIYDVSVTVMRMYYQKSDARITVNVSVVDGETVLKESEKEIVDKKHENQSEFTTDTSFVLEKSDVIGNNLSPDGVIVSVDSI